MRRKLWKKFGDPCSLLFTNKKNSTHITKKTFLKESMVDTACLNLEPKMTENWIYKKQKKSIKYQRNFCSNTFFKVLANSVSA